MDDELTSQLRALGEAAEAATPAATADDAMGSTLAHTDIAVDRVAATAQKRERRLRPRSVALLAAAVVVLLVGVGSLVRSGDENSPRLDIASQDSDEATVDRFAVPANDNGWRALRNCESTGDYEIDTGNRFYGAYQFTRPAFDKFAEQLELNEYVTTNPARSPAEIQDAVANALYLERGNDPWPVCKQFIEGPMITPVVPQWINQFGRDSATVIVFANPDITETGLDEMRADLRRILGTAAAQSILYVDRQQAYDEFAQMFDDDDDIADSVQVGDMPPSFRIRSEVSEFRLAGLRGMDGVFEVVTPDPAISLNPPLPMKVSIAAIGLESPVYGPATIDNLNKGPVVHAGNAFAPVIAGYGSIEGAVFAGLVDLQEGDRIEISTLTGVLGATNRPEIVRHFEVVTSAQVSELEDLPPWSELDRSGLILVADVADQPTQRLVVMARTVPPILSSFGQLDD